MIDANKIRRDERGAAAIEMAFAMPILLLMVYGVFQFGVILMANAGMQHALGQGARYATIYPTPSDTQISAKMSAAQFGTHVGTFSTPSVSTPGTDVCTNCRQLSMTYTVTPNFLFFSGPQIVLVRNKQVYLAS